MPDTAIGTNVHQSLDVHGYFGTQGTFDAIVTLDGLTEAVHVGIVEIPNAEVRVHARGLQDPASRRPADSEDIREADLDLLFTRKVNASNSSHDLPLPLLVLW